MSNEAQDQFFELGFQYYVAARYAFAAGLFPVCGNLFHHAIEMFIKGFLFHDGMNETEIKDKLTDLQKKYSHHLGKLWDSFKNLTEGSINNLDAFDETIKELQKFDGIRYSNKFLIEKEGRAFVYDWGKLPNGEYQAKGAAVYRLGVEDLDQLVKVLFTTAQIDPKNFIKPSNEHALKYVKLENSEMEFLGLNEN